MAMPKTAHLFPNGDAIVTTHGRPGELDVLSPTGPERVQELSQPEEWRTHDDPEFGEVQYGCVENENTIWFKVHTIDNPRVAFPFLFPEGPQ